MKQFTTAFSLMLMTTMSFAQEARVSKKIILKVAASDSIQRVDHGYLAGLSDSGIVMVKGPIVFDPSLKGTTANTIPYNNLSEIKVQRKGSVGRGILFGALGGMFVGAIAGYASYKTPTCHGNPNCIVWDFGPGYDALGGAILGTAGGAIIGGVIGAVAKKKFVIGGNKNKFQHMKENVLDMTYRK